jgi:asparagine synthase (glutamine-hydrolysing)
MNGIYGWVGTVPGPGAVDHVLDDMLAAIATRNPAPTSDWSASQLRSGDFCAGVTGRGSSDLISRGGDIDVVLSEITPIGDAAAVAAAYRRDGESVLNALHGRFALALFDRGRGHFLLAIDRAGVRPLFVHERGGTVFFASRLEMLRSVPGFDARVDDQAVFDYLYFHMIPSPRVVYRDVSKLLPAQVRVWRSGEASARFYWHMPYREKDSAGFDDLRRQFRRLLPEVVGAAGAGGDRVGCFLSGGTDSSSVSGTWRQLLGEPIPTYSMGFDAKGFDEMEYARIAARHFETTPREYYVTAADVVDSIPRIAAYCDEPFGNASIVPTYLCARFAKDDGVDTLLAGDGGDEIFGGNERYANQWVFELYGQTPAAVRALLEATVHLPGLAVIPPVRKALSYIDQAKVPLPDRFETYNFLHRTALDQIFEPGFLARVDGAAPLQNLREVYARTASESAINRMMHLDLKITLADNDLRKVNQACGLAGVDVRYPLLDDRMLEFAASVPPSMHLKRTRLRWFFKQALADFLPSEIVRKRKQGFGLPVGLWMVDYPPLRELTHESIAALKRRDIVRPDYIDWVERKHASEHASYYGVMLWVLVMLEQWMQTHDA